MPIVNHRISITRTVPPEQIRSKLTLIQRNTKAELSVAEPVVTSKAERRSNHPWGSLEDSGLRLASLRAKQYLDAHGLASNSEEIWKKVEESFAGLRTAAECSKRWERISGGREVGLADSSQSKIEVGISIDDALSEPV